MFATIFIVFLTDSRCEHCRCPTTTKHTSITEEFPTQNPYSILSKIFGQGHVSYKQLTCV